MIDGTIIKVHRHRAQWGTQSQAIGKSGGGLTTKIVALTDALAIWCASRCCPGSITVRWASPRVF